MDYFDDVFHTFLGLDSVNYLAVNGTVINDKIFILGWSNPLMQVINVYVDGVTL